MESDATGIPKETIEALSAGGLSEEQTRQIVDAGPEAALFALLELSKQLAQERAKAAAQSHQTPATPSGMKPAHAKPPGKKRKRRSGAKPGHPGSRRKVPERVDRKVEHRAAACPDCGGKLKQCKETRVRHTEDIPDVQPEVTEHTIHRDWCPTCKKRVEPPVPDALPGGMLGNHVLVLSAWPRYSLGNTLSQIVDVFNFHLRMDLTSGGLLQMWYRLQTIFHAWHEQIQSESLESAVPHGDESGWRVNGKTHSL